MGRRAGGAWTPARSSAAFTARSPRARPAGFHGSASLRRAGRCAGSGTGRRVRGLVSRRGLRGAGRAQRGGGRPRAPQRARRGGPPARGTGTASIYRLLEGAPAPELAFASRSGSRSRAGLSRRSSPRCSATAWMRTSRFGLWQRQLTLGPAPEYCMLAEPQAPGAASRPRGSRTVGKRATPPRADARSARGGPAQRRTARWQHQSSARPRRAHTVRSRWPLPPWRLS